MGDEPKIENYDKGMTIEQMAEYDATHPEIKPILRETEKYSEVEWKVID